MLTYDEDEETGTARRTEGRGSNISERRVGMIYRSQDARDEPAAERLGKPSQLTCALGLDWVDLPNALDESAVRPVSLIQ